MKLPNRFSSYSETQTFSQMNKTVDSPEKKETKNHC